MKSSFPKAAGNDAVGIPRGTLLELTTLVLDSAATTPLSADVDSSGKLLIPGIGFSSLTRFTPF